MTRAADHLETLRSRADAAAAARELLAPLAARRSTGGARVTLGHTGAHYPEAAAHLEGYARPLWALASLAFAHDVHPEDAWPALLDGLRNGTNPDHPEYWGGVYDGAQHLVEMPAIAFALLAAPRQLWTPLTPAERERVGRWLGQINHVGIGDNNWLWFRVLVDVTLERLGLPFDLHARHDAFGRIDAQYLGDGWYADGHVTRDQAQLDHYVAFAMHYYGLLYAALHGDADPERAQVYRSRARAFTRHYLAWFAPNGAALPLGRRLTYRFAMGAFWGALAFADVEALPWGELRGVWARHLRWWAAQPARHTDGTLSVGYAYPNLRMSEEYNSPQSPYWAMKAFLPLALRCDHPFWSAEEAPHPDVPAVSAQPHPGLLVIRDAAHGHVYALSGRQHATWLDHGPEKYAKFAYSTAFSFSVPVSRLGVTRGAFDSVLALSDDDAHYRPCERVDAYHLHGTVLYARWTPWADVTVETWLVPVGAWHARVHRLVTPRLLTSAEGGWAAARPADDTPVTPRSVFTRGVACGARTTEGASVIVDLLGAREATVLRPPPNTNLLRPRTLLPTLLGRHPPGVHVLACAVLGVPGVDLGEDDVTRDAPTADVHDGTLRVRHQHTTLLTLSLESA